MTKNKLANWVRITGLTIVSALIAPICHAQSAETDNLQENKRLARAFYDDLWFNNNTEKYSEYVADTYVVHDIGDRKNVTEPAVEQKHIAELFFGKTGICREASTIRSQKVTWLPHAGLGTTSRRLCLGVTPCQSSTSFDSGMARSLSFGIIGTTLIRVKLCDSP
jgi:hypothetical protein